MSTPVPMGQYVPGESSVHRLDARAKIGVTMAFSVALFLVNQWVGLALVAAAVAGAVGLSGVPVRTVMRGLRPVAWLVLFTVIANALRWGSAGSTWGVGQLGLDADGMRRGLFFGVRIAVLVTGTSLVTLTTSPVALTDALSALMRPLGAIRFPAEDAAMMLSIALRFVPTTAEEAERIVIAQTARGARFDQGGPVRRAKAWVPVLIPLFVRLFRRADDLAIAMESRCYSGQGRTHLREPVMRATDWVVLVVAICGSILLGVAL